MSSAWRLRFLASERVSSGPYRWYAPGPTARETKQSLDDDRNRVRGMLNENDVVAIVERYLCDTGWKILRRCSTTQTGPGLEAEHPTSARRLFVEAKGATSARPGSRRYGRPFDRNQARDHIANAFYAAAKVRDEHASAFALPRTSSHEDFVEAIRRALVKLKSGVLWIGEDRAATTWNWQDDRGSE